MSLHNSSHSYHSDQESSIPHQPTAFTQSDDDDNIAFLAKVNQIQESVQGTENQSNNLAASSLTQKEDFKDTIDTLLKEQNELELEFSHFPLKQAPQPAKKKPTQRPKRQTWQNSQPSLPLASQVFKDQGLDDFCQDQQSAQCWDRIQTSLLKNCKGIQLNFTKDNKPVEASVVQTISTLITQLQDSQSKQRSYQLQQDLMLKHKSQESNTISKKQSDSFLSLQSQLDTLKQSHSKDVKDRELKQKQTESKIKDLKIKLQHSEALVFSKDKELIEWQRKWDRRDMHDDKHTVKNKQMFEQYFGQKVQAGRDDKTIAFMRMYEVQIEKLKKEIERCQASIEVTDRDPVKSRQLANEEMTAQNEELRDMLSQNSADFKDLLKQLDQLRQDGETKQAEIDGLNKEIQIRPTLGEANQMKVEMKHLRNQIQILESSQGERTIVVEQPPIQQRVFSSVGLSDSKLVVSEICEIFQLPSDSDNVQVLETLRKIQKVVQAVPRMEGFIQNISRQMIMTEDCDVQALPLEQIIPRLQIWKQIVQTTQSSLEPLMNFKSQICQLVLGPQHSNVQAPDQMLVDHLVQMKMEHYEMTQSQPQNAEDSNILQYLKNLFATHDNKELVQKVNDFFTHVQELNTFVRIARSILQLDVSVSLQLVLETVKNVLIQHK